MDPALNPTLGEFLYRRRFSFPGTYMGVCDRGGRFWGVLLDWANFKSTFGVPFIGVRLRIMIANMIIVLVYGLWQVQSLKFMEYFYQWHP